MSFPHTFKIRITGLHIIHASVSQTNIVPTILVQENKPYYIRITLRDLDSLLFNTLL